MSEHEHGSDDEHHIIGGAAIPLPPELLDALRTGHDRAHMQADAENARLDRFLSGLDVDGLLALRYLLVSDPEGAYGNAKFYDGLAVALLKFGHKVDPRSGEPLDRVPGADEAPTS